MLPFNSLYTGSKPNLLLRNSVIETSFASYNIKIDTEVLNHDVGEYSLEELKLQFYDGDNSYPDFSVNYVLPSPYIYTIEKAPLMATASSYNIRYGEVLSEIEITYAGFVNGENESVLIKKPVANYNATDMLHVGEYHITLSGGEAQNYTFSYQSGTLTVGKAPLTVTAASYTNRYGEGVAGNQVSYQGFVYDEDETTLTTLPTVICEGGDRPHAGTHTLTPSGGEARDYEFVYEPGTLTVEKSPLTVTAETYTNRYGEGVDANRLSYKGFVYDEDATTLTTLPAVTCEGGERPHVGTHALIPSGGEAQNYEFVYEPGTLTVEKAPLTVTADTYTNRYGEGIADNRVSYQGFVYDEDETVLITSPTITCVGGDRPHVGTHTLTPSGGEAQDYEFVYEPGTLTVGKTLLTATPKPCTMAYGDNLPPFEIAYEGFVYDEDESVLTATPRATTDATSQSDTDTYPILLSGGEAQDYEFAYESGTLTIEQAEQEIWWPQDFSAGMLVGEEMELYATATCGEDVLFSSSDEQVILIDSQTDVVKLICLSEGEATITANQHGNKNYKPAPAVRKTIQVKEVGIGTGFSSTSVEGLAIYPNPATTYVDIQVEGGIKRVLLHSLAGMLLMDEDGQGEATYRLDLTRLPQGTYLLTVETPAGIRTERIVKE